MLRKWLLSLLCILFGAALIVRPALVASGIKTGLSVCVDLLLPSLFPWMALTGFVALSGLGTLIARPLRPITRLMLRLPDELGAAALSGLIGGFPTGARTLATLVEHHALDPRDAARMLHFSINPGPGFVITAVGSMMFHSAALGGVLLFSQLFSSLLIGALVMRCGAPVRARADAALDTAGALVAGVSGACSGMLTVCSWVMLFSVVSSLASPMLGNGLPFAVFTGILEVTSGCALAASLGGSSGMLLAAFLLSFSGLSVLCQVLSLVRSAGIRPRGLLLSRLCAGALSAGITALVLPFLRIELPAFCAASAPIAVCSANRLLGGCCLMGMAAMVLCRSSCAQRSDFFSNNRNGLFRGSVIK